MSLAALTPAELEVVRRAMKASLVFIGAGFDARMGITQDQMEVLLAAWPNVDDTADDSDACLAINNALNDLLHGVGIKDAEARQHVGVGRDEMVRVYHKWALARGWSRAGVR